MNWFRERWGIQQDPELEKIILLPSMEGLVFGRFFSLEPKEGFISCDRAKDLFGCETVSIQPKLLAAGGAEIGDTLAFDLVTGHWGNPVGSAPMWRYIPDSSFLGDMSIPRFVGEVKPFASGNGGRVLCPLTRRAYGRDPYIQKAQLRAGRLSEGDKVAFNVRTDSEGRLEVVGPLFKSLLHIKCVSLRRPTRDYLHPLRRILDVNVCSSNWSKLPLQLLLRTSAASGPVGLALCASTCTAWRDRLRGCDAVTEGYWMMLLWKWYPEVFQKDSLGVKVPSTIVRSTNNPTFWRGKFATRWSEDWLERRSLSKRPKSCWRCGAEFCEAHEDDLCQFHSGHFGRVGESGMMEEAMSERRVRQALLARNSTRNRPHRPRVPGAMLPGPLGDGDGGESVWMWSCCGIRDVAGAGCCTGPHI